jgi:hypothetical protein
MGLERICRHTILPGLLLAAVLAAPAAAASPTADYKECWQITLSSAQTGAIVIRSATPGARGNWDVALYENPFRWIDTPEPAPSSDVFVLCLHRAWREGGVFLFSGVQLPTKNAGHSVSGEWPLTHFGSWNADGDADGMAQIGINLESGAAQVILVRGPALKRVAMVGAGSAVLMKPE